MENSEWPQKAFFFFFFFFFGGFAILHDPPRYLGVIIWHSGGEEVLPVKVESIFTMHVTHFPVKCNMLVRNDYENILYVASIGNRNSIDLWSTVVHRHLPHLQGKENKGEMYNWNRTVVYNELRPVIFSCYLASRVSSSKSLNAFVFTSSLCYKKAEEWDFDAALIPVQLGCCAKCSHLRMSCVYLQWLRKVFLYFTQLCVFFSKAVNLAPCSQDAPVVNDHDTITCYQRAGFTCAVLQSSIPVRSLRWRVCKRRTVGHLWGEWWIWIQISLLLSCIQLNI